ncbi:hypothetical protein MHSWG343_04720 [Candidatus Mycoplasma haematohominis]|uniref:Uncharacterized protein n=1 Tax=Candidatus Mycoplasma haematohominis TaxID=1494318 RepID=A0A478FTQ1_9MOLU|nr:hypothetical protein MHSWG343_04720 [Candidatus Mycoplasma haemohominis]
MDPIKGAAALGAGAVAIGGTGYGVYSYITHDPMPTDYVVLAGSGNDVTGTNQIGNLYGNYLVAPYGKDAKDNKTWWEWSFRRWQEDSKDSNFPLSDDFSKEKVVYAYKASGATGDNNEKSLNKVCKSVFDKDKGDIDRNNDTGKTKEKLRNALWRYCSFFGEEPKTIKEVTGEDYEDNTNGKTGEAKYVGVKGNDKFWEARNKEFYEATGTRSGSSLTGSGVFKTEYDKNTSKQPVKEIRDICEESYKATTSTTSQYPSTDMTKFCTLDGN